MDPPQLKFLYTLKATLSAPLDFGEGPNGFRRCVPITGGQFEGPRLKGVVLYGGADHMIVAKDRTAYVDTRYNLQTHDGALIYIRTNGVRTGPADALDALLAGKLVDQSRIKFFLTAKLETGDERYEWLNKSVIVAKAQRTAHGISYDAYEVV